MLHLNVFLIDSHRTDPEAECEIIHVIPIIDNWKYLNWHSLNGAGIISFKMIAKGVHLGALRT